VRCCWMGQRQPGGFCPASITAAPGPWRFDSPMLIIFAGAFYICVCGVPMAIG
jgi:hypothetical protein